MCATCSDLTQLYATSKAACRNALKAYRDTARNANRSQIGDVVEELKQTTAARSIIAAAIRNHQARSHAVTA